MFYWHKRLLTHWRNGHGNGLTNSQRDRWASHYFYADREALGLMWRFYRERLTSDLGTALARAQRAALTAGDGSPLFWAAFALFGDAAALPAPGPLWRWLARWRRERHGQRFPSPSASGDSHAGD